MSLATILRRGVGLRLEVMSEPSADALAETLVAFANADGAITPGMYRQVDYRWGQQ